MSFANTFLTKLAPVIHASRCVGAVATEVARREALIVGPKDLMNFTKDLAAINLKNIPQATVRQALNFTFKTFQVLGLFTIGEMIGRGNLIGYKV
ncbi:hypothetical protein H696_05670 [Fonticula alba]|uniref:F-type H+-transporting ATPase subunit G n=1 Tax=Fonticula alba TaxID=691883 RepID=A0A058Z119_FONAL|nr:hypothetical protein H696_05670 [Fonticula alba]KCV67945.1 hypothetical protein H696_05670 [Fonticula alba]|eukprot:XP_009497765.1 hypothetical protein H696_05670 [Fonticula alba]